MRSNQIERNLFNRCFANAIQYGKELGITKNIVYTFVQYNSNPTPEEQVMIKTSFGTSSYRWIDYEMTRDPNYTLIGALFYTLSLAKEHDGRTLVIVPKIKYCESIKEIIRNEYPDDIIGTVHSDHSDKENNDVLQNSDIIVTTFGSVGTGGDIAKLRNLIIMDLYSSEVIAHQLPKRLRPLENGEDSYCYELVNTGFESILDMVRRKKRYIKDIAKDIKTIKY